MIKLIALDMDGTLLDSNKQLPEDFNNWVLSHPEINVVISSGRQFYALEEQFNAIKDKLIFLAENGSVIVKNGEVIYEAPMNDDEANAVLDLCEEYNFGSTIVCGLKSAYFTDSDDVMKTEASKYYAKRTVVKSITEPVGDDDIFKVAIFIHDFKAGEVFDNFPQVPDGLTAVLSGDSWIDIAKTGVDKGSAIKVLQDILNVTPDESMAFGDYLNDYTLLKACTHSYAMANAHPDLKAVANKITKCDNDHDGVMKTLKEEIDNLKQA